MKHLGKKLSALLVTAAMAATMAATAGAATTYSPVTGTSTSFKKYLVLDSNATVPNVTFTYTLVPGTAKDADETHMAVLAGVGAPSVSNTDATFTTNAQTYSTQQTGDASVTLTGTQKYAKQTVNIDFSSVTFNEPGVYRYTLTEVNGGKTGITYDTAAYTLDVYVTDNGSGVLAVSSYVLHTGTDAPAKNATSGSADVEAAGDALATKIDGIQNTYASQNLYVGKLVTGNQGSRDKYFAVTVTVTKLNQSDVLNVQLGTTAEGIPNGNADTVSGTTAATISGNQNQSNPTSLTADSDGKATGTFYLQSGQYVAICGLPQGAHYKVEENNEDYTSTAGAAITVVGLDGNDHLLNTEDRKSVV